MKNLAPVTITISGPHDTGRTTLAALIKNFLEENFLEENGYSRIDIADQPPLPFEQKDEFARRFARNRERPIKIKVETVG